MKLLRLLLPFLLLILVFGCTDGGAGIFYSIEKEEKIANKALSDYLTGISYAVIGNDYYAPVGGLYTWNSTSPGSEWSEVGLPSGWRYSWNVATNGSDRIYVILENEDGDDSGLFIYNTSTGWTSEISVGTGRPYQVWYTDSAIYAATVETASESNSIYNYRLYHSTDTASNAPSFTIVDLPAATYPSNTTTDTIRDMDTSGGTVYCITSSDIFSGTGTALTSAETVPSGAPFPRYLFTASADTGGGLFLSAMSEAYTGDGYVYKMEADWTLKSSSVGSVPNDFGEVDTDGDGTAEYLLVGSNNGYYESTDGESWSGESATIDSNYENTELEGAVVNGFFDVPNSTLFFALTSSNGLWRNTDRSWDLE